MVRGTIFFLVFLLLLAPAVDAPARVVDGATASDNILRSLSDFLDAKGIDVRNGKEIDQTALARPQLTNLSNFPADEAIAGSVGAFDSAFSAGVNSDRAYLVAVKSPGTPQPTTVRQFTSTWNDASKENRVFISFSGRDLNAARIVAEGMRKLNYVVFLYKNDSGDFPAVNAVETGQFFRTAGHRFVIDTANARTSAAVNAEALALKTSRRTVPPIVPPPSADGKDVRCCHICHYRDGVLVGCDPPVCDAAVCAKAR
jgi:hypothetical protein